MAAASRPPSFDTAASEAFDHVETIRDPDGVIAVITERRKDGRMTFQIAREYEDQGKTKRTPFLRSSHIAAARRLLSDLEEKLQIAEDRARAKRR